MQMTGLYCLQQEDLCLLLFSDPERLKGPPCGSSGRQRKKYLLTIVIFKGLAAADLLDPGGQEL